MSSTDDFTLIAFNTRIAAISSLYGIHCAQRKGRRLELKGRTNEAIMAVINENERWEGESFEV